MGEGLVQIGNTGRPLKDKEIEKFGLKTFPFAIDGVALVVNPANNVSDITAQQAAALGRTATQPANQRAIANLVYGGEWGKKNLGNQVAGDGWKYRGRGLKQVTGLSNYRSCGQALKLDLVTQPELLERDDYAARSATWFYVSHGCLLHSGDVERVTLLINGGRNGLDKRRALFNQAKSVLV